MRIERLSLDRFGHFTDRTFDFGPAGEGHDFHIIYGPNEAGKTTTMEAVLRLFYGFPLREGYAFKHPRSNLQVSATLDIDGVRREVSRLPTRGASLVDGTGTALPEAALSAHLAGLSEQDYRRLLCLDDETIERGGEEIANAEGDIGRLLFSAAAGVADLSEVLDGVRDRADALWKKRGRTTRMAELKRELSEVEGEIRQRDVSASSWKALKRDLSRAQDAERDIRARRDALMADKARTEALRRALPLIDELQEIETALAPCAAYPERLDFDPEHLVGLRSERRLTAQTIERLTDEIATLGTDRAALTVDPALLALASALQDLDDLAARDRTATLDLDRRQADLGEAETAMRQAARDLGVTAPDVDVQPLVVSAGEIATLEATRDGLRAALSREDTEAREVADLRDRVSVAAEACDDLTPEADSPVRLSEILLRYDADSLAPAHAEARQAIDSVTRKARQSLSALAVAGLSFDALPDCPTSSGQAATWAERHAELVRDIRATSDKRDEHLEDAEDRRAEAASLAQTAKVVSDTEAADLRRLRDARWADHLAEMDARTASGFHDALEAHDGAADARLAQSRDLAQLRELEQAEAKARLRAAQMDRRLEELGKDRAGIEADVAAAAARVGYVDGPMPADWLDWVQRHATARQDAEAVSDTRDRYRSVLARAAALKAELAAALGFQPVDLDAALAAARRLAEDERKQTDSQSKAQSALRQAERDLARREERHGEALRARDEAQALWLTQVRDLLGGLVAADTLMASLEPLRELRDHDKARLAALHRVETMTNDQARFGRAVDDLARAHGVDPQATSAQTYDALGALARAAREARIAADALDRKLAEAEEERRGAVFRQAAIDEEVAAIAAVFPDPDTPRDIDGLRLVVNEAQQVIDRRAARDKLRRQILSDLGLSDIDRARDALADTSATALDAALDGVASDLAHAEDELTRTIQARVTAEHALAAVKGDDSVATLVARKATLELELAEAAVEHLELSLGHHLATDAIRRYRDRHRSGMLTATEQCFASLTQGAYPSLSTQIDKDAEVLLAVDANGVSKRAAEMSKGTRFQLYLALRAAAHEQLVAQGTRLPFFCDDIFETFDEARTSAACRVMETIGGRGQAIYLTHHRHVVEIAQAVCTVPPVIHEI